MKNLTNVDQFNTQLLSSDDLHHVSGGGPIKWIGNRIKKFIKDVKDGADYIDRRF